MCGLHKRSYSCINVSMYVIKLSKKNDWLTHIFTHFYTKILDNRFINLYLLSFFFVCTITIRTF